MLNNRITSLTCIHREAGIKHSAEEEKKKRKQKRRKKGEKEKDGDGG